MQLPSWLRRSSSIESSVLPVVSGPHKPDPSNLPIEAYETIRVCPRCLTPYVLAEGTKTMWKQSCQCKYLSINLVQRNDQWRCTHIHTREYQPSTEWMDRAALDAHLALHWDSERIIAEGWVLQATKHYNDRAGTWYTRSVYVLDGRTVYCSPDYLPQDIEYRLEELREELKQLRANRLSLESDLQLAISDFGREVLSQRLEEIMKRTKVLQAALPEEVTPPREVAEK